VTVTEQVRATLDAASNPQAVHYAADKLARDIAEASLLVKRARRGAYQQLWDQGMTLRGIAAMFGISQARVGQVLGKVGRRVPKQKQAA